MPDLAYPESIVLQEYKLSILFQEYKFLAVISSNNL
jgi:hypothetical protein